jgi:hypothetical protein
VAITAATFNRNTAEEHLKLIAKWKPELEPAYDEPSSVVWEDGAPATLNDYRTHELDTHGLHASDDGGMECHVFRELRDLAEAIKRASASRGFSQCPVILAGHLFLMMKPG